MLTTGVGLDLCRTLPGAGAIALAEMPEERTLYVGNLPYDITEEDVRVLLEERIGALEALLFPRNNSGRPTGYAYAAFVEASDMGRAIVDQVQVQLNGRVLRLAPYSAARRQRLRRDRVKPKEMRRIAAAARARRLEVQNKGKSKGKPRRDKVVHG